MEALSHSLSLSHSHYDDCNLSCVLVRVSTPTHAVHAASCHPCYARRDGMHCLISAGISMHALADLMLPYMTAACSPSAVPVYVKQQKIEKEKGKKIGF